MGDLAPAIAILCSAVVTGALLVKRRHHPVTIVLTIFTAANLFGLIDPAGLAADDRLGNANWALTNPMIAPMLTVFPDGPHGRLGRGMLRYQIFTIAFSVVTGLAGFGTDDNPTWWFRVDQLLLVGLLATAFIATGSLGRRWWRAEGTARGRYGVLFAAAAFGFGQVIFFSLLGAIPGPEGPTWLEDLIELELFVWILCGIPMAIGITVLMDDPAPLIGWANKALSWAIVIGLVVTVALVVAVGISRGEDEVGAGAVVVAAIVASLIATPARRLVQRPVDALLPRARPGDDALHELSGGLATTAEPDDVPDVVARTLADALRVRAVRIEVDGEVLGSCGDEGEPEEALPLVHAGRTIGRLVVTGKVDERARRAFDVVLPHVAAAVAASALAAEVRRSRDEERARVRADLHDELSPSLAGMRLAAASIGERLRRENDPDLEDLAGLVARIEAEAGTSVQTIRRIVDGLTPIDVEHRDGGLAVALRERALAFHRPGTFDVTVASADLPTVGVAVEVAMLRTAAEAVSNAARHSQGRHCSVHVSHDADALVLEVADDGRGMTNGSNGRTGVGLGSMRRRTEDVGGTLVIETVEPHGTRVVATFPTTARS